MKYKALEDLINILIKKSGFDINKDIISSEISNLEQRKKNLNHKIDDFCKKMENNDYILKIEKDKDLSEKEYLEKSLESLKEEKLSHEKELEKYSSSNKNASYVSKLKEEINNLAKKLYKTEIKVSISDSKIDHEQYIKIKKDLDSKKKEISRKQFLEEEINKLNYEIAKVERNLKRLNKSLNENLYKDDLLIISDEMTLKLYGSEIEELDNSIHHWQTSPLILGSKILDAFKSKKPINSVEKEIEELIKQSNKELRITQEEIKGTNIFEVIDKYEGLFNKQVSKIQNDKYINYEEKDKIIVKQEYHCNKINKFKSSLEGIKERKNEVLNLISVSKDLSEEIKQKRIEKETTIFEIEKEFYNTGTTFFNGSLNEINKLIDEIKLDISNDEYLENEYIDDIYALKEELKNLEINYGTIEREIEKEERVLEILNSKLNEKEEYIDKFGKLRDLVLSALYFSRLNSIKNQQQYLYVDSTVIKEEIYNLWKNNSDNTPIVENIPNKENTKNIKEKNVIEEEPDFIDTFDFEELEN